MYQVHFHGECVSITKNISPAGFIPIWDTEIVAYKLIDIPSSLFVKLPEYEQDLIMWFFEDLEYNRELNNYLKKLEEEIK